MAKIKSNKYITHVKPFFEQILKWKKEGCTEEIISIKLGISHRTLVTYKNQYNELKELLVEGDQDFLFEVEKALYKKALGFEYIEVEELKQKSGDKENIKIVKRKKYFPPSDVAIFFTLTNLCPEKWKHKNESDIKSNDLNIKVNYIDGDDD